MTKFKAFAIHLGISLIIFLIILSIIVFYWYPPPFFSTDGGWQGIRIIAAVDLVLGPLLTLIVYKKGKPKLKMDLTIIGFIQAGALAWGIWVVHHERPVAAVFTENRFSTVVSYQLSDAVTEKELKSYGDRTPVWIYSDLPEDINELQQLRIRALQSGKSLARFHEYYRPIGEKEKSSILASSFDLQEWTADKQKDKKVFDAFQKKYADILDDIVYFPWFARHGKKIIALHKDDLSYIGSLDIAPPTATEEKIQIPEVKRGSDI